jgi:hypothetical protein
MTRDGIDLRGALVDVAKHLRWQSLTRLAFLALTAFCAFTGSTFAEPRVLKSGLGHYRSGPTREWADFPAQPEGPGLKVHFQSTTNDREWSLRLRQQDVRQTWKVVLNGKALGRLLPDENDMVIYLPVPAGAVVAGENTLAITQDGKTPDDVRIGDVILDDRPVSQAIGEATVEISVTDGDSPNAAAGLPCRITIVNAAGALMIVGARSGPALAVRPGVIYTANGTAHFGVPAGDYTIYAGRGFEYGLASTRITVGPGDHIQRRLTIRREVALTGHVSCDTHVHTLTYSGHGDAGVGEQVLAIAGEGLVLPIAAEHNRQVDYNAAAVEQGVRQYFTPVIGNEVTTPVGHFNVFPLRTDGPVPDFKLRDWKSIFGSIEAAGGRVTVLNHPRDQHSGFRPFGPERHLALTAERLDGWELRATGMEVVNSGAQQTDPLRLVHDWFGLLNRGLMLTPVGASDSHDVSRYIVGQGRTYIRCDGARPGAVNLDEAVASFRTGRVLVSCGLVAEITVNDKYGPGDLVPRCDELRIAVRVLGPSWVDADTVVLYANGVKVREAKITRAGQPGVLWSGTWSLPRPRHDVHLVAVATGPGVTGLYWPIARPYQPTSPVVRRRVIGISGAVWIDADGDGKRTSAYEYARRLVNDHAAAPAKAIAALADHDEAVAAQFASLLQARGVVVADPALRAEAARAAAHVERAFQAYAEAWRDCQVARAQAK